jgi:hypothetical protein
MLLERSCPQMAARERRRTQEKQHTREAIVSNISTLSNPRIFYGWFVVAAAFAITFVGAALGWRNAYLVLGLLAAVVGAGMALMIESRTIRASAAWVRTAIPSGRALHQRSRQGPPWAKRSDPSDWSVSMPPA